MNLDEIINRWKDDPALIASLNEAIGRNAEPAEISEIFGNAGIDAEKAEILVAEYQRRRGIDLSIQSLDDSELEQVAGGGHGNTCSAADTSNDSCTYTRFCDSYYRCTNNWGG